jgi:hypothetical protein
VSRIEQLIAAAQRSHDFGDAAADNALCAVEYLRWDGEAAEWAAEKAAEAIAFDKENDDGPTWDDARTHEQGVQCELLRDIFGPPTRRSLDPVLLTPTVVSLAQAIYRDRSFDRMPILADALEDAGCTNADILSHCRQPGEHCRGCWVVDLLLGKE